MPNVKGYAVYNRTCGHIIAVHNVRSTGERLVAQLAARGQFSLRIRIATDGDLAALIRDDRCAVCSQDGTVVAADA